MTWDVEGQDKIKIPSSSGMENSTQSIPPFTMKSWLNHKFTTDYVIDDDGQIVEMIPGVINEDDPETHHNRHDQHTGQGRQEPGNRHRKIQDTIDKQYYNNSDTEGRRMQRFQSHQWLLRKQC